MSVSQFFAGPGVKLLGPEIVGAPQYDRRCAVLIQANYRKGEYVPKGPPTKPTISINTESNDIRIKFKLKYPFIYAPNLGSVEVYNLSDESIQQCTGKNIRVSVLCGYAQDIKLCGTINAIQINHKLVGSDWISKFEGNNGIAGATAGRINKTFAPGAKLGDAILSAAKGIGNVGSSSAAAVARNAGSKSFKNGKSLYGLITDELRSMLDQAGMEFAVFDDQVVMIGKNETTADYLVVSAESGLVGSPEYVSPPMPGKPALLKVKILMNPVLRPGGTVLLKTRSHGGLYKLRDVEHSGDTHGGDWYTTMEILGINGAK